MNLTLTLPESLIVRLQRRAGELNVALDDLAWKLFNDGLMVPTAERDAIIHSNSETLSVSVSGKEEDGSLFALQAKVAEIRSRPPNPAMIIPPTKTIAEVVAYWDANPPAEDDIPPDEWDNLWTNFEADMKAADRANDIAEGRF